MTDKKLSVWLTTQEIESLLGYLDADSEHMTDGNPEPSCLCCTAEAALKRALAAEEVEVIPLDRVRDVVEKFEKLADQAEEVERRIRGQAEGSDEEASYLAAAELEMGRSVAYGFAAEYLHEKFPDSTKETK